MLYYRLSILSLISFGLVSARTLPPLIQVGKWLHNDRAGFNVADQCGRGRISFDSQ
jgi:hypothetical protein